MRQVYVDHYESVDRAVGRVLEGADRETVVHDVFCRLMTEEKLRATFRGGSMRAWITTIARNAAIDAWRRQQHERPGGDARDLAPGEDVGARFDARVEAQIMVDRFRADCLPDKWRTVFEARFIQQLDQSEAARALGIHRTTLLYRELRVRQLLRRFFLQTEPV